MYFDFEFFRTRAHSEHFVRELLQRESGNGRTKSIHNGQNDCGGDCHLWRCI